VTVASFDLSERRSVHLVGVGGAGMSGLARMLIQRGHRVTGSDRQESRTLDELRALGAEVWVGHHGGALGDVEVVVRSTAISDDNPELAAARGQGLPVLHRSEMLAALMEGQRAILVAGTHGKTTTTSMTVVALHGAGLDPSFAIGGALNEAGANAHTGSDDLFVAEADESDRSFLNFAPDLAVVTNVGLDHPDEFDDVDDAVAAFRAFLGRRPSGAPALLGADDRGSMRLVDASEPVLTYGIDPRADVRLLTLGDRRGELRAAGESLIEFTVGMPGRHNLVNASAALAACWLLDVDLEGASRALATFTGPQRRFQVLGTEQGVTVVDDYAHNPTKLRAALSAARSVAEGRVIVIVQPHLYSRTGALGRELGQAAAGADVVIVTDVYGAREDPIPGITGELVADGARDAGAEVIYEPRLGTIAERLAASTSEGDLVLVTGAGDVDQVGPALLRLLGGGGG
jgi:UDP-N-acetylmuramate--alanine ligase